MVIHWPAVTAAANVVVAISAAAGLALAYLSLQPPNAPVVESATFNKDSKKFVVKWYPVEHINGIRDYSFELRGANQADFDPLGQTKPSHREYSHACDLSTCTYGVVAISSAGIESSRSLKVECHRIPTGLEGPENGGYCVWNSGTQRSRQEPRMGLELLDPT